MRAGRLSYLFKNMALFTISSFVSKLLVFLLVPFYTSTLTESEYGIADVMQSTLLLLVPLLSLNMGEAALRFGLEDKGESRAQLIMKRRQILFIGLRQIAKSIVLVLLCCLALLAAVHWNILALKPTYILFFLLLYSLDSIYEFLLLYCQGTEQVQVMIIGSVCSTIILIISNLNLILLQGMGINGYFISQAISFAGASAILIFLAMPDIPDSHNDNLSGTASSAIGQDSGEAGLKAAASAFSQTEAAVLEKEMTEYGTSMLIYSTASWVNNAMDRYFILGLLGSAANGLYSAAYKIPAILQVFQRIFAQAWQMSAVKEYKGEDRDRFFSSMFRLYNAAMVIFCGAILLFLKPIALILFKKGFFSAWTLVPPLLISVIFGALEGFLGSICLAFKDGRSMGRATSIGAAVNLVLNYFGILCFGAYGAALATLVSYFTMFIFAYLFARKHTKLNIGWPRALFSYCVLMGIAGTLYLKPQFNLSSFLVKYLHNSISGALIASALFLLLLRIYSSELTQVVNRWKRR